MRHCYTILFLLIATHFFIKAEGTRELAPNASVNIDGNNYPDVAALHIDHDDYGNFAAENQNNPNSRLHINIQDPSSECILLGFSRGRSNGGGNVNFDFRIKDPNGNVIFSSNVIDGGSANINDWEEAYIGPAVIYGAQGYDAIEVSSALLSSAGWTESGNYYIEFDAQFGGFGNGFMIEFWDITVADCSGGTPIDRRGRVWSAEWALFTPLQGWGLSHFDRPFNGSFYIVAPDENDPETAFVSRMDFNGSDFRAAAFNVALNSFGARQTGDVELSRQSVRAANTITGEYPVFLNDPVDIYETAEIGQLEILGSRGCLPDNYCFLAKSTQSGEVEILLDFFGNNGVFDPNTSDKRIYYTIRFFEVDKEICIEWNGKDGLGDFIEANDLDLVDVYISFRQGIYHFPVYDVELLLTGFTLENVRPISSDPLLYYDDSNINYPSLTGSPSFDLNGCETPCHTWSWPGVGSSQVPTYGNLNTINSWWYAQSVADTAQVPLRFDKTTEFSTEFCASVPFIVGDSIFDTTGEYEIVYRSAVGCDSVLELSLVANEITADISSGLTLLDCDNPTIILDASGSVSSTGLINYEWTVPDGVTGIDLSAESIEITNPGLYGLRVRIPNLGCFDDFEIEINADQDLPQVQIEEPLPFNCYLDTRILTANASNVNGTESYMWMTENGQIVSGINEEELTISAPGFYTVFIIEESNGCTGMQSIMIERDTTSPLEISGPSELFGDFCKPLRIPIEINVGIVDSIRWDADPRLSCLDCLQPELLVDTSNTYFLTVTDTNGCVRQKSVDVSLNEGFNLYIPNAFSPNDDGINDYFKLYSAPCDIDIVSFEVFDRWGKKVYEHRNFMSTDTDYGWDGWVDQKIEDPGVFVWQVKLITPDGLDAQMSGDVHLMR